MRVPWLVWRVTGRSELSKPEFWNCKSRTGKFLIRFSALWLARIRNRPRTIPVFISGLLVLGRVFWMEWSRSWRSKTPTVNQRNQNTERNSGYWPTTHVWPTVFAMSWSFRSSQTFLWSKTNKEWWKTTLETVGSIHNRSLGCANLGPGSEAKQNKNCYMQSFVHSISEFMQPVGS